MAESEFTLNLTSTRRQRASNLSLHSSVSQASCEERFTAKTSKLSLPLSSHAELWCPFQFLQYGSRFSVHLEAGYFSMKIVVRSLCGLLHAQTSRRSLVGDFLFLFRLLRRRRLLEAAELVCTLISCLTSCPKGFKKPTGQPNKPDRRSRFPLALELMFSSFYLLADLTDTTFCTADFQLRHMFASRQSA
jgi:hypothetical protein